MNYEIKAQADPSVADIFINDIIGDWIDDYFGFGVTSKAFIKDVQDLPEAVKTIRLHINSPGGDVMAASHIANTLRDQRANKHRKVEVLIEGAAWSAATIITSAGQPTLIADNALMMVHDPWSITLGNAREMRKEAEVLDKFRDTIVAAYRWKSPLSVEALVALMEADTWMDADEAVANGFADGKIAGASSAAAAIDDKIFAKLPAVPEKYQARVQALLKPRAEKPEPEPAPEPEPSPQPPAPEPEPAPPPAPAQSPEAMVAAAEKRVRDIVELCAKAGVPAAAASFIDKGLSAEEVAAKLADAEKIRARCVAAKLPDRADRYISAGLSLGEVSAELLDVMLARQAGEIDNKLTPEGERRLPADRPKSETSSEIYARRRKKR